MSASPIGLLKTRRLWPLALTQSCGALNDNLVKNAMVVLALFQLGIGGAGLSALAGALFIAPYILLSATAGQARRPVLQAARHPGLQGGRGAADGGRGRSVPDRERARPAGRADRPRRAGGAVRAGEIRPAAGASRRGRTGRRQRRDRGDDIPVHRLRHRRRRRAGAAAARHRLGRRGRHRARAARAVRRDCRSRRRPPPIRRCASRRTCSRETWRVHAPCRRDPPDLAVASSACPGSGPWAPR